MPDGGGDAEAALEALQPLGGEGDFGEQDEGLAVLAEGFGDGFQVGLSLAGTGDAVQQGDAEFAGGDGGAEGGSGGGLVGGEDGAGVVWVGDREWWLDGRIAGSTRPASAMPRMTPVETLAARARSVVARGSRVARASSTFWRASVMRVSGAGRARRQPVGGAWARGARTRSAIAMTSPGGDRV